MMRAYEFLTIVRDRGGYRNLAEADEVTRTVLSLLGHRLDGAEAADLASRLPEPLGDAVPALRGSVSPGGADGPRRRAAVARTIGAPDVRAVVSALTELLPDGRFDRVLSLLQPAVLFAEEEFA